MPTCQNCETSTTPLWRRDEMGSVLCNACGLFLKLHGRPRPISLKTDVIKSRNRVKTMRPDLAKQKKNQGLAPTDMNGADFANQANGAAANARRVNQRAANGAHDDTNSPISRTGTPNMYVNHMYPNLEDQFQPQHLQNFAVAGASPGRAGSPLNGEKLNLAHSHEELVQTNAKLQTRVSELEVIQELYRGRLEQLEHEQRQQQAPDAGKVEEQLKAQLAEMTESNQQLQKDLEESHRRENMLKRRLDELEEELKGTKESLESYESGRNKRPRLDEGPATAPAEPTPEAKVEEAS